MAILVKICGLSTLHSLAASLAADADMIGLVFHPKSPRYVELQQAADLADEARGRAKIVALVADADDRTLKAISDQVEPDLWQLHGKETPARVGEIRERFKLPVMKAIGVAAAADLVQVAPYKAVADYILLDAKPPAGASYPGGHGQPFDWSLLKALDPKLPFILSGGLDPQNVAGAIKAVRALGRNIIGVDVSSGVEGAKPGQKSIEKIREFVPAAKRA